MSGTVGPRCNEAGNGKDASSRATAPPLPPPPALLPSTAAAWLGCGSVGGGIVNGGCCCCCCCMAVAPRSTALSTSSLRLPMPSPPPRDGNRFKSLASPANA
jgi:hypothetical protein